MGLGILDSILELLKLNKFFLAIASIWAFVLAYLNIVNGASSGTDYSLLPCDVLTDLMRVFLPWVGSLAFSTQSLRRLRTTCICSNAVKSGPRVTSISGGAC
jgi:hypothetical protein